MYIYVIFLLLQKTFKVFLQFLTFDCHDEIENFSQKRDTL